MITLSVTEDEYSKITEVFWEILFIRAVLFFILLVLEYPIIVHIDNVVGIFPLHNTLVYQQKNHIDVHHHFVSDYA